MPSVPRPGLRALRRPGREAARGAPVLLAVLLLAGACGPGRPPGRFAVVQRGLTWERVGPAPPPLSRRWSFAGGEAGGWEPEGLARPDPDGGLRLEGEGSVALVGPPGERPDLDVLHVLVVRARAPSDVTLAVGWRGPGEEFSEYRRREDLLPVRGDDGLATWTVRLDALHGAGHGPGGNRLVAEGWVKERDAVEGVAGLRLAFATGEQRPLTLTLQSVALVSDFDGGGDGERATARLARQGIFRPGLALPAPTVAQAEVDPGPWDRLRLAVAAAGAPLTLVVGDADGRLPEQRLSLEPGRAWRELAVDLSPLAGRPARLRLEARAPGPGAVALVGSVARLAPSGDDPPDVLLYLEDTLRADHLATYGYPLPTDDHLLAIAADGVVCEHVFAASNWTRPATASLHASLDPAAHGSLTHADRLGEDAETLAEALADAGWLTAAFVTNYNAGSWAGLDQGFDVIAEPPAWGASHLRSTLTSELVAGPLDAYLEEHADERVFVSVHSLDPHIPYEPPSEDAYALVRAGGGLPADAPAPVREAARLSLAYSGEVRHNDRQLARLDATLARLGLLDRTLLAFTSDHGEGFGEHGAWGHRETLFQQELAVPLVLRWPGHLPAGRRVAEPLGHVDVAPSLLGLIGLPVPAAWEGRDLSALLAGVGPATGSETPLVAYTAKDRGDGEGYVEQLAVVHDGLKLIVTVGDDGSALPVGLYDLATDPDEEQDRLDQADLAPRQAALLEAARTVIAERAAHASRPAAAMDPEVADWMREMGYLK